MNNLIEDIVASKKDILIESPYYLWWNNTDKKVYLTEKPPPPNVVIKMIEGGWSNHGLRTRDYGEIHEDYMHFHFYHEDRVITIFKNSISKQEIEKISYVKRALESH
jgi:hypothetical protein